MKTSFKDFLILFIICVAVTLLLSGCFSKTTDFPDTNNKVLKHLLKEAPVTTINLDHFPVDTLYVKKKNILGQKSAPSMQHPVKLGWAVGLIKVGDKIYVADRQQNCIWAMNNKGVWIHKIGRKGRGPGEFGQQGLGGIYENSNYIYTVDQTNLRIQVYDHRFDYKFFFRTTTMPFTGVAAVHSIGVTNSRILLPLFNSRFQNKKLNKLIQLREPAPPFAPVDSIFRPLIPSATNLYNIYLIDTNKSGQMVLAIAGLPYLFIMNKKNQLIHTLYLKTSTFAQLKNPPIESTKNPTKKTRIRHFFLDLIFTNNGSILILTVHNHMYWIARDGKNYRFKKAFHLMRYGNSQELKKKPQSINISNMILENDTLYTCSIFEQYVYRFVLKGVVN